MRKRAESQGRGRLGEGVTTATGRQRINGVERHRKEISSNPGMTTYSVYDLQEGAAPLWASVSSLVGLS